jgi:hypothetical protein
MPTRLAWAFRFNVRQADLFACSRQGDILIKKRGFMADWENKEQDEIIELTDITCPDSDFDEKDQVIDLTEIIQRVDNTSDPHILPEDSGKDADEAEAELFFDYKDKYLKYEKNKTDFTEISQEDLEAALERVIEKQYADKIQSVLLQTVEKVVEKQISELKESLKKDFENMDGVK